MSQSYGRGNQGPPGTLTATEVEIDFGTMGTRTKIFTITDPMVTTGSKVATWQSGNAATGRQTDENEMDPILFSACAGNGTFTLYANSLMGPVKGLYRFIYIVS